jgi:cytochrome oxidase assembly protein ShyY1
VVGIIVLAALAALGVWALRRQTMKEFPPAATSGGP